MGENIKDQMNQDALFSAETEDYRSPMEPEAGQEVCLRMRTAKDDADHVYYIEGENEVPMEKTASDEYFDY